MQEDVKVIVAVSIQIGPNVEGSHKHLDIFPKASSWTLAGCLWLDFWWVSNKHQA